MGRFSVTVVRRFTVAGIISCAIAGTLHGGLHGPRWASAAGPHTVAPGETLSEIADRYNIPLATLVRVNGLLSADSIFAGEVILLEPSAGVTSAGASPAPASSSARVHIIAPGESLSGIADQFNVPIARLMQINQISDANRIFVGQELVLGGPQPSQSGQAVPASFPGRASHRIAEGESLSDISDSYGVSISELVTLNKLADPDHIYPGQTLTIPETRRQPSPLSRQQYESLLRSAAAEFRIPPHLLMAIAWQESGWQQGVVSHAGAVGLMQLLPITAEWAVTEYVPSAKNWRTSPADNARVGAAVLRDLLDTTDGNVRLSIASYYQGLASINKVGWYSDTKDYVTNVLSLAEDFK